MERILLNVPYEEKDKAKSMGARWDAGLRTWWVTQAQAVAKRGLWKWMDGASRDTKAPEKTTAPKMSRKLKRANASFDRLIAQADKSKPKRNHANGWKKPATTERTDESLIDCGCTHVAPWDDCGCGIELDADQAEHMRSIATI